MRNNKDVDPKNVSAFMVHHVLHPRSNPISKNKKTATKKLKKKRSVSTPTVAQASSNERIPRAPNHKFEKKNIPKRSSKKKFPKEESKRNVTPRPAMVESSKMPSSVTCSFLFEEHFRNKTLFQWMIHPISIDDFMSNYWEKKPLYIPNDRELGVFSTLISTPVIDELLTSANVQYTKNVDITCYDNGVKELHNLEGRARSHVVWDFYLNGCSVRMLNPQTFVPNVHKLCSELQEYFGGFVGCNAYLTPPHSQGFAPHYDDIEAFILQIEGKKRWKVYEPRSPNETLPRFSSNDFVDDDLGKPMMEVLLSAGDVLYLPRGYIHQAVTEQDFHSLHTTISAYQCNAWIDLLQKVVPKAMENAWKKDIEFRQGLPLDYLHAAGLTKSRNHKNTRIMMENKLKSLIYKLADHMQMDSAVDQLASKFLYDALPPVLTEEEKSCSVFGDGLRMSENGRINGATDFEFDEETEIVLLRKFVSRLVKEISEEGPRKKRKLVYKLYYTTDNSLEYHGEQTSFSLVPKSFVPCIQYLFQNYPKYVTIKALPHDNLEDKINFASDLWERGIIRSKYPLMKKT